MPYHILVQGMTPDMSQANGDYDAAFEYQVNTPDELLDVIRRVAPLREPPHPPDVDVCPPNLVVTVGNEQFMFMPDGGNLYCTNANGYVTPEQALQLITTPGGAAMARQAVQQQSGIQPARMAHIPPTDRENFSVDYLNMGPQMPQVHFTMRRDHDSGSDVWVWGITAAALLGIGIFVMTSGAAGPGLIIFGFGALAAWAAKWSGGRANVTARVGFDWNWNAMWSVVGDEKVPGYLLDANLLTDVVAIQATEQEDSYFVPGEPSVVAGGGKVKLWKLRFVDVQGEQKILDYHLRFFKQDELQNAMNAIRGLMASQR